MFKEIVLKNRKTSLVLESTISKVSKVNLNHFSTNWIRKCGISFKRIALILERKTNFFDSDSSSEMLFKICQKHEKMTLSKVEMKCCSRFDKI